MTDTPPPGPSTAAPPQVSGPWSDDDAWLFAAGQHDGLSGHLGAIRVDGPASGPLVRFGVWAPHAVAVGIIGDFNDWSADRDILERTAEGLWFGAPRPVTIGDRYKVRVVDSSGRVSERADPFAAASEVPPATASVITDLRFDWRDDQWMNQRADRQASGRPVSIYEVHLGSWRRGADGYRSIAEPLADHVVAMGATHVEFLPMMEHPFYGSWGYQVTGYFAPTARYGVPSDLMYLVDVLHRRGIGVLFDWVPSHFPTDAWALARFDGEALFEHPDPRLGFHPDWTSNIFDYERLEVCSFLRSSASTWMERFHADGVRVDAVASMLYRDYSRPPGQWLPNADGGNENWGAVEFLRGLTTSLNEQFPGALIVAEESTAWPGVTASPSDGGLGFTRKWDMGWMNDTLRYFARDPIHRSWHHDELTFRSVYSSSERFVLSLSHDEVVHGKGSMLSKMPGDDWQAAANLRSLYAYQFTQTGSKLIFMGDEIGVPTEWNHDNHVDWSLLDAPRHRGILEWVTRLNRLYCDEPALHRGDDRNDGLKWIVNDDATNSVFVYERRVDESPSVVVVLNLTPSPLRGYRIGLPAFGEWEVIANSDDVEFGGAGFPVGAAPFETDDDGRHGYDWSIVLDLPPLACLILRHAR